VQQYSDLDQTQKFDEKMPKNLQPIEQSEEKY
jgi:hypothetical protein